MKTLILATAALIAAPVAAQSAATPTQAPATTQADKASPRSGHMMHKKSHMKRPAPMFRGMSEAGRKELMTAMRASQDDRAAVSAARDKIAALVGADKLDSKALQTAMDEERRAVDAQHARQQQRVLAAISKLSTEDRKAFAADTQKARAKMRERMDSWR
ncbi:MAG: periplasmic heavy metal sensor, partial [Paracoccaceae bacterium]